MNTRAYFMDFEFDTEKAAFYPRFETEILVEKACELLLRNKKIDRPCDILDIGTGCGNIAISLTKYLPSSRIMALDISDSALRVARKNALDHGVIERIEFVNSNLFQNIRHLYKNYFDLIISNPPYVSKTDFVTLPPDVKMDPYVALYGGKDGMDIYRAIIDEAPAFLKKEAMLLMEIGYDQAKDIKTMLDNSRDFKNIEIYKDYSDIDRIVKAEVIKWIN